MPIVEYEPGEAFPGVIGRTAEESSPAWPAPVRAEKGAPNVLFIVLDDTGFGHLGCYGSPIETPNLDGIAAERAALQQHAHDGAVLAEPVVHRHRPEPPRQRHGVHHRARDGLSRATTAYAVRERDAVGDAVEQGYSTFMVGKWHLTPSNQETAAGPYDRWPLGRGFQRFYGFLGGDTSQWYPDLVYDNHQVEPPKKPEEGYHLSEDLVDKAIAFIADTQAGRSGQAVLPAPVLRRDARPAPRGEGVGRQVRGRVRRRLGRLPRKDVRPAEGARDRARPTPSCHATIPTSPTGTRCPPRRGGCSAG